MQDNAIMGQIHNAEQVVYEIGFGRGEFILNYAKNNSDTLCLAAEAFIGGAAQLINQINLHDIKNIRILIGDGRELLEKIPDSSLDKIFLFFSDPWPKTKHHKRRVVSFDFLKLCHDKLKTNERLIMATDNDSYKDWILIHIANSDYFYLNANNINDFQEQPEFWVTTQYQQKAITADRKSMFFDLIRKS